MSIPYPAGIHHVEDKATRDALKECFDRLNQVVATYGNVPTASGAADSTPASTGGSNLPTSKVVGPRTLSSVAPGTDFIGAFSQPVIGSGTTDPILTPIGTGSGTVTTISTGTGLTGGPISSSGTIALANTAVVPGSYTNTSLTVDAQGRLTAASNGTSAAGLTPLSTTVVNINSTASQLLYQAPVGKTAVLVLAIARSATVDISGYLNNVALLENTSGESVLDDFTTAAWSGMTDANHFFATFGLGANAPYHSVAAGNKVNAKPSLAFGSAASITIELYGHEF